LIDHDVHSNTGGWNAAGGMGPGKVLNFNQIKQSQDHDKMGLYIKTWCPELENLGVEHIHEPWKMSK
jgi:deoxyribodipyrimidine photo-lyase